jgi:hypothetical protein
MQRLAHIIEKVASMARQDAIDLLDVRVALQNSIIVETKKRNKEGVADLRRQLDELGEHGTSVEVKELRGRAKLARGLRERVQKLAQRRFKRLRDPNSHFKTLDLIGIWAAMENQSSRQERGSFEVLLKKLKTRHACVIGG